MYARFTDRARKVMQLANQEAQRLQHDYIGTEHILLGLLKEGSGVAVQVLTNLSLDPQKIVAEVERVIQNGVGTDDARKIPSTPRAERHPVCDGRGFESRTQLCWHGAPSSGSAAQTRVLRA